MQADGEEGLRPAIAAWQGAGRALTGWPAALTAPLERIHLPGGAGRGRRPVPAGQPGLSLRLAARRRTGHRGGIAGSPGPRVAARARQGDLRAQETSEPGVASGVRSMSSGGVALA